MGEMMIGQIPHSEGDLLPKERRETTRTRAKLGALGELESLLEFREDMDDWKAEGLLMQAYSEQSADMMIAKDSLRRKIATIRNYSAEDLTTWISNHIGFEHMETANTLAELAKKTPKQLLNECKEYGDEHGKVMTVDQLTTHALGEQKREPALFRVNVLLSRLGRFPELLNWASDKRAKFTSWLDAGREFFQ
jgi:hypothetical protein